MKVGTAVDQGRATSAPRRACPSRRCSACRRPRARRRAPGAFPPDRPNGCRAGEISVGDGPARCHRAGERFRAMAAQAGDRHAVTLPLGVMALLLKSAWASSHSTRRRLPSRRQCAATAVIEPIVGAVVAAEQNRQAPEGELAIPPRRPTGSRRRPPAGGGNRSAAATRVLRTHPGCRCRSPEPARPQPLVDSGDPQRFGAHRCTAGAGTDIGRCADQADRGASFRLSSSGTRSSVAQSRGLVEWRRAFDPAALALSRWCSTCGSKSARKLPITARWAAGGPMHETGWNRIGKSQGGGASFVLDLSNELREGELARGRAYPGDAGGRRQRCLVCRQCGPALSQLLQPPQRYRDRAFCMSALLFWRAPRSSRSAS